MQETLCLTPGASALGAVATGATAPGGSPRAAAASRRAAAGAASGEGAEAGASGQAQKARPAFLSLLRKAWREASTAPAAGGAESASGRPKRAKIRREATAVEEARKGAVVRLGSRAKAAAAREAGSAADREPSQALLASLGQSEPAHASRPWPKSAVGTPPRASSDPPRGAVTRTSSERTAGQPRVVVLDLRSPQAAVAAGDRVAGAKTPERRGRARAETGTWLKPEARGGDLSPGAAAQRPVGPESGRVKAPVEGSREPVPAASQIPSRQSSSTAESASPGSPRFAEVLQSEIVKHSTILVRDGGEGEIRLLLKPESLGEVRIKMRLTENSIEGRVLVENSTVRRLFEENLEALQSSLREQGFDGARLEVAVSDRRGREGGRQEPLPSARVAAAVEELERAAPLSYAWGGEAHAVDLVV